MEPVSNATVYIVDDDAEVREALAWLLRSRRVPSEAYDSAESFEQMLSERLPQRQPCCLLLDVRMPGMSGLALFDRMIERGDVAAMPVIFLRLRLRGTRRSLFDHAADNGAQIGFVKGFFQKVDSAFLHGAHGHGHVTVAGNEHNRDVRLASDQGFLQL